MKKPIALLLALALVMATPTFAAGATETAVSIDSVFSSTTRTECVTPSTGSNWVGQALGGILGAAVGSQIGGGKGNTIATASGAVLGAQAGGAITSGQPQAQVSQECRQIVDRRLDGYSLATDQGRRVFVPLQVMQSVAR